VAAVTGTGSSIDRHRIADPSFLMNGLSLNCYNGGRSSFGCTRPEVDPIGWTKNGPFLDGAAG
jgi:hypothetical protein